MPNLRPVLLCLMVLGLSLTVCAGGFAQPAGDGTTKPAARPATEADVALDELSQDIDLLNTINRLDLQPAQIQPLLALTGKVHDEKAKLEPQRQAALAELIPLLREKRTLLLADKEVSADLDGKIQTAQTKVDDAEQAMNTANVKYVPDMKKVLTEAQVSIITGADEARSQAEELLQWIRDLPEADYADEAKSNAAELSEPELNLRSADIMKIFDEARKISAAEYNKNRQGLVNKLAPLYMPMPEAADDAMVQFFASPRLAIILQDKTGK